MNWKIRHFKMKSIIKISKCTHMHTPKSPNIDLNQNVWNDRCFFLQIAGAPLRILFMLFSFSFIWNLVFRFVCPAVQCQSLYKEKSVNWILDSWHLDHWLCACFFIEFRKRYNTQTVFFISIGERVNLYWNW